MLVTIIAETGSSPRSAGSRMLVAKGGRVCGTIGGGPLEYQAVLLAGELLEARVSRIKTYRLYQNDEEDLGMVCGGDVEVYFQFMAGHDAKTIGLMQEILSCLENDEDAWLFTEPGGDGRMALYRAGAPPLEMAGGRRIFSAPVNVAGKVYIFGGGHVAQALEPLLSALGFRCVIFDSRPEFTAPALFPTAYDLITGDYLAIFEKITIRPCDYAVIVTHACDTAVLRQVITRDCAYTGVIGSKRKIAALKALLRAEGIGEEKLNSLHAPIGLPIHSQTPEEIAVSIAGEMIKCRAERR
jgi:xanthine dehydrogenase accessory factor